MFVHVIESEFLSAGPLVNAIALFKTMMLVLQKIEGCVIHYVLD